MEKKEKIDRNIKIMTAQLATLSLENNSDSIVANSGQLMFDPVKKIDCIVIGDTAIDLTDGEEYHVINRIRGKIDPIELTRLYGGGVNAIRIMEQEKTSFLYHEVQIYKANSLYRDYINQHSKCDIIDKPIQKIKKK